jgi:hypothetical protein
MKMIENTNKELMTEKITNYLFQLHAMIQNSILYPDYN